MDVLSSTALIFPPYIKPLEMVRKKKNAISPEFIASDNSDDDYVASSGYGFHVCENALSDLAIDLKLSVIRRRESCVQQKCIMVDFVLQHAF